MIDYYLPLMTVKRHTTDKPWVTDQFCRFIRCRQYALKTDQASRYRTYPKACAADIEDVAWKNEGTGQL